MIDYRARVGGHEPDYAIIGSLSQVSSSDNRDCDIRKVGSNRGMAIRPLLQPEIARVLERLDALRLKQKDLADAIGIEENKVSKVRSGERQLKAAELLKANDWLAIQEARVERREADTSATIPIPGDGEVVQIQKLDLSLSMGPGTLIDGYVESELVNFDLNFIRLYTRATSDRLRLVTGIGDSMEPTLKWGDLILIDTNDRMLSKQDGIYWINLYGAAGIKRLRAVGPRRILVKSDNPAMDDQEVDAEDLRIEGRAIWATRGL